MADGDVTVDQEFAVRPAGERRVDLFAVEDSSYPGGYYYHFQYYNRPRREALLRYDNTSDAHGVGDHHRHACGAVSGIEFESLSAHVS
ncbi:MAG: DUF6516 family protein [Halobacteriales archaeon]